MTETATPNTPIEASASSETSATLLAPAGDETGKTQQTQTTETQAAAATETPAKDVQKTEPVAADGVPEKYTFTAPEGKGYDPAILESFSGAAKEAGLTQDAAQKLIETMAPAITARQADQVQAIYKGWQDASTADKEFGGEKLAENLGVARKALENFGTPELRTMLDATGLGNHPEIIRLLFRAGKAISEDKFVGGSGAPGANRDPLDILYPPKKKG